ncbi:MAG TPA: WG repeat-containing protein, partial [Phormidium sp.]
MRNITKAIPFFLCLTILSLVSCRPLEQIQASTPVTQQNQTSNKLFPVKQNGKYGYIDQSGKVVITAQFDEAFDFSEGMAKVKIADKFGYIDRTGKTVISPQFDDADDFSEGLAGVMTDGKMGFIDNTGQMIITPQFDDAED